MRGFVVTLIVLLVLAAVAFGFGWVQLLIPPGSCAVVATKTGGFEDRVIRSGEFAWRWERLIPTNMTLYRFDLSPHRSLVSFGGSLPSAELYASIMPASPDFSFDGEAELEMRVRTDSLPALVREGRVAPDSLQPFYEAAAGEAAQVLTQTIAEPGGEWGLGAELDARLLNALRPAFPEMELLSLTTRSLRVPDRELYELARDSYRQLVRAGDEARNAAAARLGVEQAEEDSRRRREESTLASLREYGKLLEEYPVLLKAMYVHRLAGKELAAVPGFDLESFLAEGQ